VHSAGIEMTLPLRSMQPFYYEKMFSINVISGFELARIISKKKYLSENGASFVFISSVFGVVSQPAIIAYSSSKGALISGVKSIALELASRSIRVNCISPGQIKSTSMSEDIFAKLSEEERIKRINLYPLGLGEPVDIAYACAFLLSDTSRWITGINLIVDGGYSAK